jgi:hypothetical protein
MHVEVMPASAALRYPPAALKAALQTPATALLAATIAAEQLASSAFVDGTAAVVAAGGPSPADVLAYASGQLTNATMSGARFSRVMFIIRRLSSSQGLQLPMGDKVGAIVEAAARLVDTAYGEAERVFQTGDDVLRTLSAAIGGSTYSGVGRPVTHRALLEVREALGRTTTLGLQALPPSTDPHPLGPSTLRSLLYNGGISSSLWRTWSFADDTSTAGRRRLLKVADNLGSSAVDSREGDATVTLDDFVAPGCGSASDAPDCLPHQVAISMTYVADSTYIYLGLGDDELRRAAVEWGWRLLEQDVVHTVSGVLSVAGSSGALVPSLAVQLPLDMQTGMSDLREDNKFCARIDYNEMRLVFLGQVEVITSVQQYPGGWAVEMHNGACWADMYGDYVLVQVSRSSSSSTAARGFVSPRTDHLRSADFLLVDPPPPSTAISSKTLQKIFLAGGVLAIGLLATVAGVIENCRHRQRPRRNQPAEKHKSRPAIEASVTSPGSDSDTVWAVDTELRHSLRQIPTPEDWDSDGYDSSRFDGGAGGKQFIYRSANGGIRYKQLMLLRPCEDSEPWLAPEPHSLPVHAALLCGEPEDIKAAVQGAQDLNAKDSCGRTALHLAAIVGHFDAVRMLLRVVNVLPNMTDTRGHTPLHLAAAYGHVEIVEALLATKSVGVWVLDVDALAQQGAHAQGAFNAESELGAAGIEDADGCTPLHVAAHFGQVEVASMLMRAGGDAALARHDVRGNTPLHHAAMHGQTETLLVMLRHCLRDDERTEWPMLKNADGHVAVDLATVHGYEETVEALLLWGQQSNVNVTRPHGDGVSLMTLATLYGKRSVSRVIRSNEWWMWEVAPEEVVLDGDEIRREQQGSFSAVTGAAAELLASEARRFVQHAGGRFIEAKKGINFFVRKFSAKYNSTIGGFEPHREHSTDQPDFPDEIPPAGQRGPDTRLLNGQHRS